MADERRTDAGEQSATLGELRPGLRGRQVAVVDEGLTVFRGGRSVLSTPSLISLLERAASSAVEPFLPPGQSTVGIEVHVRHLAPTPMGMTVEAEAELLEVDGRRLRFRVWARDGQEEIGEGEHVRYVIDVDRYHRRLQAKADRDRA